jgi:hypothetical protein
VTLLSPIDAATEGLRVARREPSAVLYWIAVWVVALVGIAVVIAALNAAGLSSLGSVRRFGPLAAVTVPMLLALWVMNTATVYRAVLRPGEHGWHLFKLGGDEARIALVSAVGTVLLVVFGGVPAYLLLVLFNPLFVAAPGLRWVIAFAGALLTVALEIWIAVRLSLATVETFAAKAFPLPAYWTLTRGHFWQLFASYFLLACLLAPVLLALSIFGVGLGEATDVALHWRNPNLLQRALLFALAPVTALLFAVWNVAFWTMFAACQAHIYRVIVSPTRAEAA